MYVCHVCMSVCHVCTRLTHKINRKQAHTDGVSAKICSSGTMDKIILFTYVWLKPSIQQVGRKVAGRAALLALLCIFI